MTSAATLLDLLHTRATALQAGDKETAYCSIQDLGDAAQFADSEATRSRAAREYELSFGEALEAMHPVAQAYDLLLEIAAERAAGRSIEAHVAQLRELLAAWGEFATTTEMSATLHKALGRLGA